MRAALLALLVAMNVAACRHVEYAYAHTITGVVLDPGGQPVAAARVTRVAASGADYGASLYATTTDATGRFAFEYHGLAGEEQPGTDHWILRATTPNGEAHGELDAPWTCDERSCPGYHADVVLRVR